MLAADLDGRCKDLIQRKDRRRRRRGVANQQPHVWRRRTFDSRVYPARLEPGGGEQMQFSHMNSPKARAGKIAELPRAVEMGGSRPLSPKPLQSRVMARSCAVLASHGFPLVDATFCNALLILFGHTVRNLHAILTGGVLSQMSTA